MALNLVNQIAAIAPAPTEISSATSEHQTAKPPVLSAPGAAIQCQVQLPEAPAKADLSTAWDQDPDLSSSSSTPIEIEHAALAAAHQKANGVPVYVMMPLDTVRPGGGGLNRKKAVAASLAALKSAGVDGIMVDVWWGIVEREGPGKYDFGGYSELVEMARKNGLKVQAVMSFHQCGGNVGDSVT